LSVLLTQYNSVDQIEKNEMGRAFRTFGGEDRVLVGTPEGKRPVGRSRHRLEINIKRDLQEVGGEARTELIWFGTGTSGGHL
jgi:hypothetical protein